MKINYLDLDKDFMYFRYKVSLYLGSFETHSLCDAQLVYNKQMSSLYKLNVVVQ